MAEVVRQRSRVVPIIGELVAGRMPQHVRMYWEWKLGANAGSLDHPQEPSCRYRRPGLGHEHIRARPLQRPQRSELRTAQGMDALDPALGSVDMQAAMPKVDLLGSSIR
jgi:hypothetical protein